MKKVRFLPFILALSLPLTGCDLFKKKNSTPDTPQTEKTLSGILLVHAPATIEQDATLEPSSVELDLSYSDGTTSKANAERVELNTATLGVKEGIAFYSSFYKTFEIEVVEKEEPSVYAVEILSATLPDSIEQDEQLVAADISIVVKMSDESEENVKATVVDFDSSEVGTKEGTLYYGELTFEFELEVVAKQEEKSFDDLKNSIIENHNYTLTIESYYENFPEERFDGHVYSLSDKAYYGTDVRYLNLWESGFISVKGQGIASFYWSLLSEQVILDTFVATNLERTVYDIQSVLVEFLLESELTKEDDDHYTSENQELIGMIANFSGLELAYISNPEQIDIYKVDNNLKIEATYTANYYDEESLDPVENEPVYLGITISDIGSTHNEVIEEFVEDESKQVAEVTEWDNECLEAFDDHYNGYVPPFPTGASYTFYGFYDKDGIEQKHYIKCQDIAAGNLSSSYASQLGEAGYDLESDGIYRRRVENLEHTLESIYEAKITYYPEGDAYKGKTYGYYYDGGVFQVEFCYYTQIIEAVTDIESLNYYVSTTGAKNIVPVFPEEYNSAKVTKFDDRTEAINQETPNSVIFATSGTTLFRIYIPDYEDAVEFYNELLSRAQAKGFTDISHGGGLFAGYVTAMDFADSKITITDMESKNKEAYEAVGYLECQIYIRNNYTVYYSVTLEKDDGVSSAHITSPYNYMKIEEGTKVTFTVSIASGYELDEITSSVEGVEISKEGEGIYSFLMPAHNITVNVSSKSTAGSEGLVYDKEYAVYVGRNSGTQYYERPTTEGSTKLYFVFNSDGSGTFTYTWFNSAGNVNAGPYTVEFNYTLISGKFMIVCTDGSDNALFGNFRLFSAGTEGNYNETGVFNENEITITLSNGSGTTKEVTLKWGGIEKWQLNKRNYSY